METVSLLAVILGAAGVGGLVTATVNAYLATKRLPLESQNLKFDGSLTLITAAEQLVGSQTSVVLARDAEIAGLKQRLDMVEGRLERVLDDLESERALSAERAHEIDKHRMELVKQEQRIGYLRKRVNILSKALRDAGIDPELVASDEEND